MLTQQELTDALAARHGESVQRKLSAATVGVAGLGGLGSHIAVHLARLGIGRLVLADFDRVELSNLHRQHYALRDIGLCKTDALAAQLREIHPYLIYETHAVRVTAENAGDLFADCDVVCEAFDRAEQKAMLIGALLAARPTRPLVSGSGMAGFGSANTMITRRAFPSLYLCGDGQSDSADCGGLFAPRVAICAAQQATMALRLLLGETAC